MGDQKPRRLTSTVLGLMLVFSVLTAFNFTSMNVLADETFYSDWEITDHQWRENTNITLRNCNLTIKNGGILTFNNSVKLEFIYNGDPGDYGITIESNGTFEINSDSANTIIKSETLNEQATYWFTNSGEIDFTGATVERVYGDRNDLTKPGGINCTAESEVYMLNCNILDADTHSFYVEGNETAGAELRLYDTIIANTTSNVLNGTGIWAKKCNTVFLVNVTVMNTTGYGIKVVDCDDSIISDSSIKGTNSDGIYNSNSLFSVYNTTIEDCNGNGIYITGEDSSGPISWSTINNSNGYGIQCVDAPNVVIQYSTTITNTGLDGIYAYNSTMIITDTTIDDVGRNGTYAYKSTVSITDTTIDDAGDNGIFVENSKDFRVDNVEISNADYRGIWVKDCDDSLINNCKINNSKGNGISIENSIIDVTNTSADNNSGNGIFIYGWKNADVNIYNSSFENNTQTGVFFYHVKDDTSIQKSKIYNNFWGVELISADNIVVRDNYIFNSTQNMILASSNENTISNNTIIKKNLIDEYPWHEHINGIWIWYASNNTIENNTIIDINNDINDQYQNIGILIENHSYYNNIMHNNIQNNDKGISIEQAHYNTIMNNNISSNNNGTEISYLGTNNKIYHNTFHNNSNHSIDCGSNNSWDNGYPSGGNYWDDYNGTDTQHGPGQNYSGPDGIGDYPYTLLYGQGIYGNASSQDNYPLMNQTLDGRVQRLPIRINSNSEFNSSNGVLGGNGSADNPWIIKDYDINGTNHGSCIYIGNTTEYFVVKNTHNYNASGYFGLYYWNTGIVINNVTNGSIEDNSAYSNSGYGIYIINSDNNNIEDNSAYSNSNVGIHLYTSDNNSVTDNSVTSNSLYGIYINDSDNNTIANNTAHTNLVGVSFAGTSNNNSIYNNNLSSNSQYGILLSGTSVKYNNFNKNSVNSNTQYGIYLFQTQYNTLKDNSFNSNGWSGIYLLWATNNIIRNNNASSNSDNGILVSVLSTDNIITNNMISTNDGYGIYIEYWSSDNTIYHNDFIDNTDQAYDECTNSWDNGYPSGGNYWDDYTGVDIYSGPNQDQSGSDGIGDDNYSTSGEGISGGSNEDNYPMMEPNMYSYMYWAKSYGGDYVEKAQSTQQTSDGGYVVAGYTNSDGAGDYDFWVLKLLANGTIDWEKTYGNTSIEYAHSIQQTSEGGYIVAGYTNSAEGNGSNDFLVIKLYSDGTVDWQKTYGNTSNDMAYSVNQTSDGGYIVAGTTNSAEGADNFDYWVLKLDVNGTVVWQKTYGGSYLDIAYSIEQTSDGCYIVCGKSSSFGGGPFDYDFWVLKLNETGNVDWQKTYGNTGSDIANSIQQTSDGGYIMTGTTNSYGAGFADYWVLKLNETGNVTWQKTYGSSSNESAYPITQTSDGGYVVAGYTTSAEGAGSDDFWVLKLNETGNVTWQKTYGGTGGDRVNSIYQTSDNGYIVGGYTLSFGAGNTDFWLTKLGPEGSIVFDYGSGASWNSTTINPSPTYVGDNSTSSTVNNTTITPKDTTFTEDVTSCTVEIQATPSYSYPED